MTNPYRCPPEPKAEAADDEPADMQFSDPVASDRRWIKFGLLSLGGFSAYLALPALFSAALWRDLMGLGLFTSGMVFAAMTAIAQAEHHERFGKHKQ